MTRYYGTSNIDDTFKKRVTWISTTGSTNSSTSVAVVEYKGLQPTAVTHGNATTSTPYIRTPSNTMDKVRHSVASNAPKRVYNDCLLAADDPSSLSVPRNLRSVRDVRRRVVQQNRSTASVGHRLNFADEILQVLAMAQGDEFVRWVQVSGSRVPCTVLYTDRQIQELKSFCFDATQGSVLAVDKTYNLSSMYVTVTCYENLAVTRTAGGKSPTFIGPIFIHGQSDFDTYSYFFNRLASRLSDLNFNNLRIGSDDELAMRKALQFNFHGARLVLCQRHLKTNTIRYARDKIGLNTGLRQAFVNTVFGDNGVASSPDVAHFKTAVANFNAGLGKKIPDQLRSYFNTRLVHFLQDNIAAGCGSWTNNACESVNHLLKQTTQWRPHKLPDLIIELRKLVDSQYIELDRALLGRGDFALKAHHAKFRVTSDNWQRMSAGQRRKLRDNCFRLQVARNAVTSTDGSLTVRTAPGAGKKANQRRRPAADRTTSTPKRRRLSPP